MLSQNDIFFKIQTDRTRFSCVERLSPMSRERGTGLTRPRGDDLMRGEEEGEGGLEEEE